MRTKDHQLLSEAYEKVLHDDGTNKSVETLTKEIDELEQSLKKMEAAKSDHKGAAGEKVVVNHINRLNDIIKAKMAQRAKKVGKVEESFNEEVSIKEVYILHGSEPRRQHLGTYTSSENAYKSLADYFDKTLDEDGAGKHLYQFDKYTIFSQGVNLPVGSPHRERAHQEYVADYVKGALRSA